MQGVTAASLTDSEALERDLIATRKRGYAIDNEERTEGMRCIAAPIFDAQGRAVAGLSILGPVFRLSLERVEELGALVRQAAQGVTEATGGGGGEGGYEPFAVIQIYRNIESLFANAASGLGPLRR